MGVVGVVGIRIVESLPEILFCAQSEIPPRGAKLPLMLNLPTLCCLRQLPLPATAISANANTSRFAQIRTKEEHTKMGLGWGLSRGRRVPQLLINREYL